MVTNKSIYNVQTEDGKVRQIGFTEYYDATDYGNGKYISAVNLTENEVYAYMDMRYLKYVFKTICENYIKQYYGDNLLKFEVVEDE